MRISEIEIGNFLLLSGLPVVVTDIDREEELLTVKDKSGLVVRMPLENFTPQLITPYWLVRAFHFGFTGETQTILRYAGSRLRCTAVKTDAGTWCLITDDGYVAELMWVHQIQNWKNFVSQ